MEHFTTGDNSFFGAYPKNYVISLLWKSMLKQAIKENRTGLRDWPDKPLNHVFRGQLVSYYSLGLLTGKKSRFNPTNKTSLMNSLNSGRISDDQISLWHFNEFCQNLNSGHLMLLMVNLLAYSDKYMYKPVYV